MLATVPLSSPVTSIISARALAESVAFAGPREPVGPAIDRILRHLEAQPHAALIRDTEGILDVLHLLATERAARATMRLAILADDVEVARYWAQLNDLVCLGHAACA